jgi:hypothetical protein
MQVKVKFTAHCLFKYVHNPGGQASVILTNFSSSAMDAWGWWEGGGDDIYINHFKVILPIFLLHVHSCTHWLRPRYPPPPSPRIWAL